MPSNISRKKSSNNTNIKNTNTNTQHNNNNRIVYEADPKDEDIVQQVVLIYISARSIPYHVKAMDIIMKRLQLPFDVPGMDQQYKQILGKISVEVAGLQKEARHSKKRKQKETQKTNMQKIANTKITNTSQLLI